MDPNACLAHIMNAHHVDCVTLLNNANQQPNNYLGTVFCNFAFAFYSPLGSQWIKSH